MEGKIICGIVAFGCAALFYSIGVYAGRLEKPMGFWAGVEVDASRLTDVTQYNRENGALWKRYALWYAVAGLAAILSELAFLVVLVLGGTLGLALLIRAYKKILQKYSI